MQVFVLNEELTRWVAKLVRHYGIDGNTDMLSKQYGLTYAPGHLQNCDFEDGFASWTAVPAVPESLRPLTIKDYGRTHLQRRGLPRETGDTTAYFERQANGVNTLSQTALNLVPGRLYALAFATSDPEDIENPKNVAQHPMVRVSLDNAEAFAAEAAELRAAAKVLNAGDAVYDALHAQAEYLEVHARFIRAMADKMGL